MDNELFTEALKMALKVDFLTTKEEVFRYTYMLYEAMKWGEEVEGKR